MSLFDSLSFLANCANERSTKISLFKEWSDHNSCFGQNQIRELDRAHDYANKQRSTFPVGLRPTGVRVKRAFLLRFAP